MNRPPVSLSRWIGGIVLIAYLCIGMGANRLVSLAQSTPPPAEAVIVGAGDIAACELPDDEATARLLDGIAGTVIAVGDTVYPDGTLDDYQRCYDPSWGRHKQRTRPVAGNHEYNTKGAAGYFAYFGALAKPQGTSYYAFKRGTWLILALNSNLDARPEGDQGRWLRDTLENNPSPCTLAIFHHPLFSSYAHGDNSRMRQFWEVLYASGVDVIINGDSHLYERFAPQTPAGIADPEHGIRQFIVGTGGAILVRDVGVRRLPTSEVLDHATHGVIKLTLRSNQYEWEFVPVAGKSFRDAGSGPCVSPAQVSPAQ